LISGVNLAEGTVEEFTASLKEKADDIAEVTHAFYFGEFQEGSVADTLSV